MTAVRNMPRGYVKSRLVFSTMWTLAWREGTGRALRSLEE
jgi:hypothetical protein